MLRAELKPLAPKPLVHARQKLAVLDPVLAAAAGTAFAIGTGAAGNFIATWVYNKYVHPRRKNKLFKRTVSDTSEHVIEVETIEERIVRTKIRTKMVRLTTHRTKR